MQVINENLIKEKSIAQSLRELKPYVEALIVPIGDRPSVGTTISRLKKSEGLTFATKKDGKDLKIWQTLPEEKEGEIKSLS